MHAGINEEIDVKPKEAQRRLNTSAHAILGEFLEAVCSKRAEAHTWLQTRDRHSPSIPFFFCTCVTT
jgi:hypothetical protein